MSVEKRVMDIPEIRVGDLRQYSPLTFHKISIIDKNWKELDQINRNDEKYDEIETRYFFPQDSIGENGVESVLVCIVNNLRSKKFVNETHNDYSKLVKKVIQSELQALGVELSVTNDVYREFMDNDSCKTIFDIKEIFEERGYIK